MSADETTGREIDWSTAEVRDGTLTVRLDAAPSEEWAERLSHVLDRLGARGGGEVEVVEDAITVSGVKPRGEGDVRHRLESAVLQANADLAPAPDDADSGEDGASEEDRAMTDAFRSFAPAETDD